MDIGTVPTELFQIIKWFLTECEYWKLLNTSNNLFSEVKYETREIFFNRFSCRRYLYDATFKDFVLSKVKYPLKQFGLKRVDITIENDGSVLVDLPPNVVLMAGQMLQERHNMQSSTALPIFEMGDFETMYSSSDDRAKTKIRFDVSKWAELSLDSCHSLRNVDYLTGLQFLRLNGRGRITNVNPLGRIYRLEIVDCSGVTDISGLTDNHFLTVLYYNTTQVRQFTSNVVNFTCDLTRGQMEKIKFTKLRSLNWRSGFPLQLGPFSNPVAHLLSLELHDCSWVTSLNSGFRKTPSIILYFCRNPSDISGLGENKSVTISRCHKIEDFSSLKDVRKVTIEWCNGFLHAEEVKHVHCLTIDYCTSFCDASALGRVYHLKLSTWVGNFKELGSVPIFECLFDIIRSNDRSVADEEERSEYLPHLGGERNKFTIFPFCVSPHLKRIFLPYANMKSVMISTMILMTIMQFPMGMMLQQILKTENKKLHCFGQTMK
jgi:hypothetical protein